MRRPDGECCSLILGLPSLYSPVVQTWKRAASANTRALVGVVVLTVVTSGWWFATGSERRIDAACGTWLEYRPGLRGVVSEYDEAVGRAASSGTGIRNELNFPDVVANALDSWASASPGVRRELTGSASGSGDSPEDNLHFFLVQVDLQLESLEEAATSGDPNTVRSQLAEASARFQIIDDICLYAARDA